MKITKYLITICLVCCAATTPAFAGQKDYTGELSSELSKGFDKIVEMMNTDSGHESVIRDMAILALEKKIEREIKKKQKTIQRALREVEWLREHDDEELDQYLDKIAKVEKEIAQYTELQNKIQALKSKN